MDIKELRERAMYNPRSLTKAEWDLLYEEAFHVSENLTDEDAKSKSKRRKEWW